MITVVSVFFSRNLLLFHECFCLSWNRHNKSNEAIYEAFYTLLRICYSKCGPQPATQAIPGSFWERPSCTGDSYARERWSTRCFPVVMSNVTSKSTTWYFKWKRFYQIMKTIYAHCENTKNTKTLQNVTKLQNDNHLENSHQRKTVNSCELSRLFLHVLYIKIN